MKFQESITLCLLIFVKNVYSANILYLDTMFSPSINMWNRALMNGLLQKGHNLSVVTTFMKNKPAQNLNFIYLEKAYDYLKAMNLSDMSNDNVFSGLIAGYKYNVIVTDGLFESEGLQKILDYPDDYKFDLIINDYIGGPALLPLLHKFNYPPLVQVAAFDNHPSRLSIIGGHHYPAYAPHYFFTYDVIMNFWERLWNFVMYNFDMYYRDNYYINDIQQKIEKRFNFKNLPHVKDLEKMTTLILVGSDYSFTPPVSRLPNEIFVGGLQIADPKPLEMDLLSFLENSKKGTVLMSLGTGVRSDSLNTQTLKNIIQAFSELPDYNFLWKFESDKLPIEQPKNVKIIKFLPQNDLLAHSKLKAFITHAGSLSAQEALWYGKPCIAIPFFLDQFNNAKRMVNFGVGTVIDKDSISVESIKSSILSVLENYRFSENAQRMSKQFRDQPEKPLERAVWWVEYILRHPNPDHLQSPTKKLGFFVSESYDMFLLSISIATLIVIILVKLIKKLVTSLKRNNKVKRN